MTTPKVTGFVCDTCGERKPRKRFRKTGSNPATYSTSCMACLTKAESEQFAEQAKEHRVEKLTRQEIRKRDRKLAKDRARERRKARAEKRKANKVEQELARRELARRSLLYFTKQFHRNYIDGWVHRDICRRLEKFVRDVAAGKSPRLMLFMPPRHGKSELASKSLPAWALGHHPHFEIIASSYAVSLPLGFSRKVRGLLRDAEYQQIFPNARVDNDNQSAEGWMTTKEGGYVPAGVGGGITGKGAHMLLIDDPVKDDEEADSATQRDKVWDWYGSTAKTRLAPGGGVLVIQTRWHDDDLAGRMLLQMKEQIAEANELMSDAKDRLARADSVEERKEIEQEIAQLEQEWEDIDHWEVVSYPAIAEQDEYLTPDGKITGFEEPKAKLLRKKGEALHPARFPLGRLRNMKRTLQPRHWSALYQQNPVPEEGMYFTKPMFRYEPIVPDWREMKIFVAWDLAIGQQQKNDYTVGAVGGLDYDSNLHILDIIRARMDSHEIVEAILNTHLRYGAQVTGIEKGQLEKAIAPQLRKRMRERRAAITLDEDLTPITDKTMRARPLQGRMQQGMVLFPANQGWLPVTVEELLRFPGGIHDDIVDALAWLVRMALKHPEPRRPSQKKQKSWKDKLKNYTQGRDKSPMAA